MHTRRIVLTTIPALGLTAATLTLLFSDERSTTAGPIMRIATVSPTPTSSMLATPELMRQSLIRLNLDGGGLAAAGVSVGDVVGVVSGLGDELDQSAANLLAADLAFADARASVTALESRIQSGLGSAEDVAALAGARSDLANAATGRDSVLNSLFTAAISDLTPVQRQRLTTLKSNASRGLAAPYLVVDRTDRQWVDLREALAHERHAVETQQSVDAAIAQLLASIRADAAVAQGIANDSTNGPAIQAAWNQATQQQS